LCLGTNGGRSRTVSEWKHTGLHFLAPHSLGKVEVSTDVGRKTKRDGWAIVHTGRVLSVADPLCFSRIWIFSIPDPGSKDSRIRIRIKDFKYLT
jgi:hypothetical protein